MATETVQNETRSTRDLHRVLRGAGVGVLQQLAHLVGRLLLTPLVIASVGLDGFAFWSLLFVLFGSLGLHRMGFVAAGVPLVAAELGHGRVDRATAVLRTLGGLGLRLGVFVLPLFWVLAPQLSAGLGVGADRLEEATDALRIVAVSTIAMLIFGGYQTALEALQRHATVRAVEGLAGLVEVGLAAFLLHEGFGLRGLAIAFACRAAIPLVLLARRLGRVGPRSLSAAPSWGLDRDARRRVLGAGGTMQLFGMLYVAVATVERLALVHGVSLAAAGTFELGRKLGHLAGTLPSQILAPLVPMSAVRGRQDFAPKIRRITRAFALLAALPIGVLIAWPELFLRAWLADSVRIDDQLLLTVRVLGLAAYGHLLTGPTTSALRGFASLRPELGYTAAWLGLSLATVLPAAIWGSARAAVIAAAGSQLFASCGLFWFAWPQLGIRRSLLLRDALVPSVVVASAVFSVWLLDPVSGIPTDERLSSLAALLRRGLLVLPVVCLSSIPLFAPEWSAMARRLARSITPRSQQANP